MPKPGLGLRERIARIDWENVYEDLDQQGFTKLKALLEKGECAELIEGYRDETQYRNTIDMARYRFGEGEYKYFDAPLPETLQQLREGLYPGLALAANRWFERLGLEDSYPAGLPEFLEICRSKGQFKPTPLILKYEEGGYNCLHQDLYGEAFFPFQVVIALNQRGTDYTGGEFLLMEQRPRAQSRGHAITLEQGEGLVFPTQYRPVLGTRGYYRTTMKHGVSTLLGGNRYTLGVIFHDAK